MRILMLVHSLRRGGAERVLLELAVGLKHLGHDVKVIAWLDVDEYTDTCYQSIPRNHLLPKKEYFWVRSIPISATKLKLQVEEFRPDVIEIHSPNIAWVAAWANLGIPCVHVLHGYGSITHDGSLKALILRIVSCLAAWRLRAKFITVSDTMIAVAARYFMLDSCNSKINSVSNGIDLKKFLCKKDGPQDGVKIIMLGTLSPNKGQSLGVMAFKKVFDAIPNTNLLIVGDGVDWHRLQDLIDAHKLNSQVHLLGRRDDVSELLASSHFLWHLSESEAMPMVVLEAMATGLPVIGFDVRGTRDAVMDKKTGYLVPYGDINAIAETTINIIQDTSTTEVMSAASRSRAENYFSLDNMISGHERLLCEAAKNYDDD